MKKNNEERNSRRRKRTKKEEGIVGGREDGRGEEKKLKSYEKLIIMQKYPWCQVSPCYTLRERRKRERESEKT